MPKRLFFPQWAVNKNRIPKREKPFIYNIPPPACNAVGQKRARAGRFLCAARGFGLCRAETFARCFACGAGALLFCAKSNASGKPSERRGGAGKLRVPKEAGGVGSCELCERRGGYCGAMSSCASAMPISAGAISRVRAQKNRARLGRGFCKKNCVILLWLRPRGRRER